MPFQNPFADAYLLILLLSSISMLAISYTTPSPRYLKSFAWLNTLTFVSELWAYLAGFYLGNNWKILNVFVLIETVWHLYFFYAIITITGIRKWIPVVIVGYALFWFASNILITDFFKKGNSVWNSYNIIAASLLTVILSVAYLYQLIEDENAHQLQRQPVFWIVSALLVFYTCQIPYFGAFNFIIRNKLSARELGFGSLRILMSVLNDLMYATFTYAYLCQIRLMKYR
jgi:hypothetical protein